MKRLWRIIERRKFVSSKIISSSGSLINFCTAQRSKTPILGFRGIKPANRRAGALKYGRPALVLPPTNIKDITCLFVDLQLMVCVTSLYPSLSFERYHGKTRCANLKTRIIPEWLAETRDYRKSSKLLWTISNWVRHQRCRVS